ncbi:MAG: hypothetical protein ACOYB1_07315 [Limnohabitans sp.]
MNNTIKIITSCLFMTWGIAHSELPPKLFLDLPVGKFYFNTLPGYSDKYVVFNNGIARSAINVKFKGSLAGEETLLMVDAKCRDGLMKVFEIAPNGKRDTDFKKPSTEPWTKLLSSICSEV